MSVLEKIKAHPVYGVGAVLGLALLYFVFIRGGSSQVVAGAPGTDTQAGDALQAAQLNAQVQTQGQATALEGQAAQIGGAVQLATIQAHTTEDTNALAAAVASQQINASSGYAALHDTLTAQVANNQIDAGVKTAQISSNTSIANTQAITGALVQQSAYSAEVATAAIQAASQKPPSLLEQIFG